ncbi:hypothetical protein B9Z19DRAFT_1120378 [Tuber borchii]|uniref:Uncharacterized protein n=1 Tax=Tuber borchii TaxID=42251 RepID=A0A2T7A4M8_TUBBO|nr:hypothetical protein B9Z19DRAFT_1120378 [Tuber borchii]
MTRIQINCVMEDFEKSPELSFIGIPMRDGVSAACKAYIMEPQFNPAVESQEIDLIHSLGQTRPAT